MGVLRDGHPRCNGPSDWWRLGEVPYSRVGGRSGQVYWWGDDVRSSGVKRLAQLIAVGGVGRVTGDGDDTVGRFVSVAVGTGHPDPLRVPGCPWPRASGRTAQSLHERVLLGAQNEALVLRDHGKVVVARLWWGRGLRQPLLEDTRRVRSI